MAGRMGERRNQRQLEAAAAVGEEEEPGKRRKMSL